MSKSILILDTPKNCSVCPLCIEDSKTYRDYCRITYDCIWTADKPDWCPLINAPKKNYDGFLNDWEKGYKAGYNACIDEILGGKNI
jgi:hypothetical protein